MGMGAVACVEAVEDVPASGGMGVVSVVVTAFRSGPAEVGLSG